MVCAFTIGVLSLTTAVLTWLVHHQKQAMDAQKSALEATRATVDALKTQSNLGAEPLRETISSKDGAIQALEAQLSASAERRVLAEEKLKATQEQVNRLVAELPSDLGPAIQERIDNERRATLRLASVPFFSFGYYIAVMKLASLVFQIQSLTFAKVDKEKLSPGEYAARVGSEYFRNSVLFLHRERKVALENFKNVIILPTGMELPEALIEGLEDVFRTDQIVRNAGLVMDSEVEALSSFEGVPPSFDIPAK